jgi:voltage-gated potassium channel
VGYGDVTPITLWGKVFGATITVVGVGMVALPAGILASAFSEQLRMREKIYEEAVEKALEDGVVDDEEERILKETRENLELNTITAARIENALTRVTHKEIVESHDKCPHCGENLRN